MRWRLVGVRPFFTDFGSGIFAWALLFGVVAALICLFVGSSLSHSERWAIIAAGAGMGAGLMFIMGWLPSSVRLHHDRLWYKSILRRGDYHFSECSSIRCDRYNGILRLSLDMSPEAGWAPQTIVFAAPVKRINEILFLLNTSGKFQDSGCFQS